MDVDADSSTAVKLVTGATLKRRLVRVVRSFRALGCEDGLVRYQHGRAHMAAELFADVENLVRSRARLERHEVAQREIEALRLLREATAHRWCHEPNDLRGGGP